MTRPIKTYVILPTIGCLEQWKDWKRQIEYVVSSTLNQFVATTQNSNVSFFLTWDFTLLLYITVVCFLGALGVKINRIKYHDHFKSLHSGFSAALGLSSLQAAFSRQSWSTTRLHAHGSSRWRSSSLQLPCSAPALPDCHGGGGTSFYSLFCEIYVFSVIGNLLWQNSTALFCCFVLSEVRARLH